MSIKINRYPINKKENNQMKYESIRESDECKLIWYCKTLRHKNSIKINWFDWMVGSIRIICLIYSYVNLLKQKKKNIDNNSNKLIQPPDTTTAHLKLD